MFSGRWVFGRVHEIWYLSIFLKSVEEIQASLNSDKNNGHVTCRPIYLVLFGISCIVWYILY